MVTRVLDTNVLLDTPLEDVICSFKPCKIVIPFIVLKELDGFKNSPQDHLRANSRAASRYLDVLRLAGELKDGVQLPSGHFVKIEFNHVDTQLPVNLDDSPDSLIIKTAYALQLAGEDVILVTQDVNERIIADLIELKAEDYGINVDINTLYSGFTEHSVLPIELEYFTTTKSMIAPDRSFTTNEYVLLKSLTNERQTVLARYDGDKLVKPRFAESSIYGVKGINLQQRYLIDLLMNPDISLITVIGKAGSGKTLLSLAAGLEQVEGLGSTSLYSKLLVTRSPIPVGRDIGYLPGTELEKMTPWMGAVYDNLEFLLVKASGDKAGKTNNARAATEDLLSMSRGKIEMRAITYIRGRSICNQFIIIDEAQNLTKHEIKTIVSRAGNNCKIVLIGDVEQIDNPRLTVNTNGLVYLVEAMKGYKGYGHVSLIKSERSELADVVARRL